MEKPLIEKQINKIKHLFDNFTEKKIYNKEEDYYTWIYQGVLKVDNKARFSIVHCSDQEENILSYCFSYDNEIIATQPSLIKHFVKCIKKLSM